MREIGSIVRLQIQRSSLKTGEKANKVYDPAPLLAVPRLALTAEGALGLAPDGSWVVDVHHRAHPATKNADGEHGISVGFTAHYAAMRDRFGGRITTGCAGENILAQTDRRLTYDDLKDGLTILDPAGRELVRLRVLQVAHPCRPFTGWALGRRVEPETLKEHLQFLDDGMRGYYCVAEGAGIVSLGDRVVVR
ncbi:MAG TPA: MOSC domain-containing protein [Gemmatimonadales bacterium]|nr:MOSC domain-containing protein [Gemmatimonadales bacterium]